MLCGGFILEVVWRGEGVPAHARTLVEHLAVCAIIFATVNLAKHLICRLLSLRVNSESLFETMQVRLAGSCPCTGSGRKLNISSCQPRP